ncbi:hypothetical protein L0337_28250 [candidate division KSB1 bacterium]|nr:hypothetical protein [candidate division KSB1 bacterium]
MNFRTAVQATPALKKAFKDGLQALRQTDRSRIACKKPHDLAGSVNAGAMLEEALPNAPRWDYGVGVHIDKNSDRVIWIEIHPASSHHINDVLSKLQWLKSWLKTNAHRLDALPREFVWVASGMIAMQPGSPQRKKLAECGLVFAGSRFVIKT